MKHYDKFLHFTVSLFVYTFLVAATGSNYAAIAITAVIGIAKELVDWLEKNGSGFSFLDLLADGLGIFIGYLAWNSWTLLQ